MKLFRFHLSTLLLLSLLSGAVLGLQFLPPVWKLECTLPLDASREAVRYSGPSLAFSKDNKLLAVLYNDKCYCFDCAAQNALWSSSVYKGPGDNFVQRLRFSADDSAVEFQYSDGSTSNMGIKNKVFSVEALTHGLWEKPLLPDNHAPNAYAAPSGSEAAHIGRDGQTLMFHVLNPDFTNGELLHTLDTKSHIHVAEYSGDAQFLAVNNISHVSVWKRTRAYGWRGYLQQPLAWVALPALLGLFVVFLSWVLHICGFKKRRVE